MKRFILVLFLNSLFSFGQTNQESLPLTQINHVVTSGETVLNIATKYAVDPSVIYRENRFAIDGVSEGMELKFLGRKKVESTKMPLQKTKENQVVAVIPNDKFVEIATEEPRSIEITVPEIRNSSITHKVKTGETLYGLSKKYNVSVSALQQNNTEQLKKGLQIGQTLTIPPNGTVIEKPMSVPKNMLVKHTVKPKETLYGLAKYYGVTIAEIEAFNEKSLRKGLQIGQVILIQTH